MITRRSALFSLGFLAALTWGAVTGCGSTTSTSTSTPDATSNAASPSASGKTLKVVTSADYPPFEFFETNQGQQQPVGFDIDLATYIAEQLGYELEINDVDFNGIIPALQAKRADFAIAGMTVTEERKQSVDFSDPYFEIVNVLVVKQDSSVTGFEDLAGQKVGAQLGSTQEKLAQDAATKVQGLTVDSRNRVNEIIQEIKSGKMGAGVIAAAVAKGFLKTNPDLKIVELPGEQPYSVAIAFPKESELVAEFNRVIAEMKQNGKIEELTQKWFEDYYVNQ